MKPCRAHSGWLPGNPEPQPGVRDVVAGGWALNRNKAVASIPKPRHAALVVEDIYVLKEPCLPFFSGASGSIQVLVPEEDGHLWHLGLADEPNFMHVSGLEMDPESHSRDACSAHRWD